LDRFKSEIKRYATDISKLSGMGNRHEVTLAGVVVAMRERPLRSGNGRMAFVTIEDTSGQVEVLVFSKVFAEAEANLKSGEPLLFKGNIQFEGDDDSRSLKIRASEVLCLSDVRRDRTTNVALTIGADFVVPEAITQIRQICSDFPGACRVSIYVRLAGAGTAMVTCSEALSVEPNDELITAMERVLGSNSVILS
jgi:DNA polymerase-3 subunit alpha